MRALPDDGWSAAGDGAGGPPVGGAWQQAGVVRHAFTHFAIELGVARLENAPHDPPDEGEWWPIGRIEDAGLPTLFAKAARLARAANERLL